MERKNKIALSVIIIVIAISLTAIIISLTLMFKTKEENPTKWVLHSYGNNVALYNGEDIIEVYGQIALDTLPIADKQRLDNGIVFQTKEEARNAIEDYDG